MHEVVEKKVGSKDLPDIAIHIVFSSASMSDFSNPIFTFTLFADACADDMVQYEINFTHTFFFQHQH